MEKVLHSSGQSEQTYLPPSLHFIPPKTHHSESIKELHMVIFPIMEDLFAKTKISPFEIDILILNCSGFCPSPSLTSIVVNKYAMRSDIKTYNVSGMGCSASAICIDLAQNLLRVHKNSNAIVLSTEILSSGWYSGRGVIREVGKGLRLGEKEIEAALMTLHRFGNQSSSSLWYELAYLEAKERVKKGDNIWQLGMGSGPKCCSVVLKCNRIILGEYEKGPWGDCIHQYPIVLAS
ncbi:very-long-chain 3-oxoacyl-CoA synthase [Trifolium repens]|nr:very-long-chain 3-oxoacyl-CoA synthase [Trifolium repens]